MEHSAILEKHVQSVIGKKLLSADPAHHIPLTKAVENFSTHLSSEAKFSFIINKTVNSEKLIVRFVSNGHAVDVFANPGEMKSVTLRSNDNLYREQSPISPDLLDLRAQMSNFTERFSPNKHFSDMPS